MEEVLAAIAVGVMAGVVAGFFGVGGGIVFVPALALVLGLGQLEAEATSLAAILPTVAAGAWQQHRYGNVNWRHGLLLGGLGIAGVEVGVRVADALPEEILRRLFAVLLFAVAAQLASRALRS
ncbi:MAG TPA: sulfite exporter TauE/SafE family protein [Gaiellaceae bacterium]|nr:sulfite exporter TauE/SafE family protein [Gaiellaceae bacterium]HET8652275.1 sulfite exporter TauE/SafE family protein [Gaiellaceae bacterium]